MKGDECIEKRENMERKRMKALNARKKRNNWYGFTNFPLSPSNIKLWNLNCLNHSLSLDQVNVHSFIHEGLYVRFVNP